MRDWINVYASEKHGYDLGTLYSNVQGKGKRNKNQPCVLVAMDNQGYVFGAFSSEGFYSNNKGYYGSGKSFLFQAQPHTKIFKSTMANTCYILSTDEYLGFGGGRGSFSLWFDASLHSGTSGPSPTYNNDLLSSRDSFKVVAVEVWAFSTTS